jgi:anti-sigma-K factor RskA
MNYQQPDLLEQLAGAYVLGTLRGRGRARFERLCQQSDGARAAVHRWEDRFMPLLGGLKPVAPGSLVWERIAERIRNRVAPARRRAPPWRWALAGALALSLVVGISIRLLNPPLQAVAALGQDAAHPLWSVSRSANTTALTIRALQSVQSNPERAYELWALPRNGKAPISLGLLPRTGSIERLLTATQRDALLNANRVAVSLEPAGGSPTGSPTGPVLYVAEVTQPT